jgi:hypothetical protein
VTVTPTDLGTYLGATVDADRGQLLIDLAVQLCKSIVVDSTGNLPDGADAVVLDVATRAYSNPTNVTSQGAGPFPVSYGAVGGGLWLTRQNKATLRRLAGSGGAFTIDTLPTTAGVGLPPWERNVWGFDGDVVGNDWDQTP